MHILKTSSVNRGYDTTSYNIINSNSTSFCHYTPQFGIDSFISIENLKKGILFAMKENLMIQYVYPSYGLPRNIKDELETIDHIKSFLQILRLLMMRI